MPELESLLHRLIQHRLDFVIVGGFAATAHGVSLLTQDIDVAMPFIPGNLHRLQGALADLHPVHRLTPARLPFELTNSDVATFRNLYLDTDSGPLDCLGEVKGIGDYAAVLASSRLSSLLQLPSSDDRWSDSCKEAMGRPHDRLTILQLLAIKE
jgi:hypothetical protein